MLAVASRPSLVLLLLAALGGAAPRAADPTPADAQREGSLVGWVFDSETGMSLEGVTVAVTGPAAAPGAKPLEAVRVTDREGGFAFPSIPAGTYRIRFEKEGYRESTSTDVVVQAGQPNRVEFQLPPLSAAA